MMGRVRQWSARVVEVTARSRSCWLMTWILHPEPFLLRGCLTPLAHHDPSALESGEGVRRLQCTHKSRTWLGTASSRAFGLAHSVHER